MIVCAGFESVVALMGTELYEHPVQLLKRAFDNDSELPAYSIRVLLLADVLADLLQFKPDRGDGVAAGPEMLTRKIPLLAAQPSHGDSALPFQESDHRGDRVLGGNRNAHVHMV